jgi:hypothetical protein
MTPIVDIEIHRYSQASFLYVIRIYNVDKNIKLLLLMNPGIAKHNYVDNLGLPLMTQATNLNDFIFSKFKL